MLKTILNIIYIISPLSGFIPQIYRRKIIFSPLLSLLAIICNLIKIFHYNFESYDIILLYQSIILIILHFSLINHYTQPLTEYEKCIFHPRIYKEDGLLRYTVGLILGFTISINILNFLNLGFLFSKMACFMEVFNTFIQLVIYKGAEDKPLELFIVWILGDIAKVISMLLIYSAPIEYIIAAIAQIFMNIYVTIK